VCVGFFSSFFSKSALYMMAIYAPAAAVIYALEYRFKPTTGNR
jgi:hypothetical protein